MGLSAAIRAAVSSALDAIGDVRQTVTYLSDPNSSYDTGTGQVTESGTSYSILAVSIEYEDREVDGVAVQSTDRQLILEAAELSFTPKMHDIVTVDGANWRVENIYKDPIGAIYILQIRRS